MAAPVNDTYTAASGAGIYGAKQKHEITGANGWLVNMQLIVEVIEQ